MHINPQLTLKSAKKQHWYRLLKWNQKRAQGGLYRKKIIPKDPGFLFFFLHMENVIWLPVHYSKEGLQPPVVLLWDSGAEKETCWRQTSVPCWVMWKTPLSSSHWSLLEVQPWVWQTLSQVIFGTIAKPEKLLLTFCIPWVLFVLCCPGHEPAAC